MNEPLRLNIGGTETAAGWKILNITDGPNVDFVGDCTDLSRFADSSVDSIYASHILEHIGYQVELPSTLKEIYRVLRPGGSLMVSVPDLKQLCWMFVHPEATPELRYNLMRIMFGGQEDEYDFHKVGFTIEFLSSFLHEAGFRQIERVKDFGLFQDSSRMMIGGVPISLNMRTTKP